MLDFVTRSRMIELNTEKTEIPELPVIINPEISYISPDRAATPYISL